MRLVFIGPPGAGKGTQAKLLRDHYHIAHISTGDMLRERMFAATPTGLRVKPFVDRGDLVPDSLMVEMVAERLNDPDASAGFLLDGYPRTLAQAQALDATLNALGAKLDAALLLDVDDDELVRRLGGRWTCGNPDCGAVYNLPAQPPTVAGRCDRCNSALLQRLDDRPETIRTRLREYHAKTAPVIEYYRQNSLLRSVSGIGDVEDIQRRIRGELEDQRQKGLGAAGVVRRDDSSQT
jgi:adenylate kinase